ncbi:MAG: 16S/23S rRNA (cytidine-2'-O)-methyltransferase TlyA [Elusimicrobia bacterium ADurb.Bin231]|nr:MAG: 16S/23S rRNA (cytidine-2'-O)-methyltransferase TlyA [Elusimicrobia bacterium ADurb.Bin231]
MAKKIRLDIFLVENGLSESRSRAAAYIMEGKVTVDGCCATKPGFLVGCLQKIEVDKREDFVSRGGWKLKKAVDEFHIKVAGKICMDIGASTGGFTDCLLKNGAKKVYCVDVGYGLLDFKLRNDPRVVNIERTNIRYFDAKTIKEPVDLLAVDVSFISLEKVIPKVAEIAKKGGEIVLLVKPQFEAPRGKTKKGVVRDESVRSDTISKIQGVAESLGLEYIGGVDSPIKGPKGNLEHLLYLRKI